MFGQVPKRAWAAVCTLTADAKALPVPILRFWNLSKHRDVWTGSKTGLGRSLHTYSGRQSTASADFAVLEPVQTSRCLDRFQNGLGPQFAHLQRTPKHCQCRFCGFGTCPNIAMFGQVPKRAWAAVCTLTA